MQIATTRVHAQGPSGVSGLLPSRESEAIIEKLRDGSFGEDGRVKEIREGTGVLLVGRSAIDRGKMSQREGRSSIVGAERAGLGCPIEAMRAICVAMEMVLGAIVVSN